MLANHASNKILVPRIYEGLSKLNSNHNDDIIMIIQLENKQKNLKRHFTEEDIHMANKQMKR